MFDTTHKIYGNVDHKESKTEKMFKVFISVCAQNSKSETQQLIHQGFNMKFDLFVKRSMTDDKVFMLGYVKHHKILGCPDGKQNKSFHF